MQFSYNEHFHCSNGQISVYGLPYATQEPSFGAERDCRGQGRIRYSAVGAATGNQLPLLNVLAAGRPPYPCLSVATNLRALAELRTAGLSRIPSRKGGIQDSRSAANLGKGIPSSFTPYQGCWFGAGKHR